MGSAGWGAEPESRGEAIDVGSALPRCRQVRADFFPPGTRTHTHNHTYTYTHAHTITRTHNHTRTHTLTHTYTHTNTHMQTHMQSHSLIQTLPPSDRAQASSPSLNSAECSNHGSTHCTTATSHASSITCNATSSDTTLTATSSTTLRIATTLIYWPGWTVRMVQEAAMAMALLMAVRSMH